MQKLVEKSVSVCDFCGNDEPYSCDSCLRCGKDICSTCRRAGKAVKYQHSVYCQGSGDGIYCLTCNMAMEANPDRVFTAYQKIMSLRAERQRFEENFEIRVTLAESELEKAQKGK